MNAIAQVIVNIPVRTVNKVFSYAIPGRLDYVNVGWRVIVPFGGRKVEGFITGLDSGDTSELKQLVDTLDDAPWFDEHMLKTAQWICDYYLCTLAEALRLFIPGKAGITSKAAYWANNNCDEQTIARLLAAKPAIYQQLYQYLCNTGQLSLSQLEKKFGTEIKRVLRWLIRYELVSVESVTTSKKHIKYIRYLELAIEDEAVRQLQNTLNNRPAQKRLLALLQSQRSLPLANLKAQSITYDTVKRLVETGAAVIKERQQLRDSYADICSTASDVTLTGEQQTALQAVLAAVGAKQHQSFLVHGITGSGKTQVYLEAVAAVRCLGRQAIVLVPEIALTNQIVTRFKARFGDDVVVIHSKLSVGERFDAFQRLKSNQAGIVIGARSAIFAPVQNLGIIIMDEEHEFTYKQEETPRYHTRQVAICRGKLAGAPVILGSATPSLESYYGALAGTHQLLTMPSRVDDAILPQVTTVDMRDELAQGRRSVLSEALMELLTVTLRRREQAVIVLNRRGYATFVLCRECGLVLKCRHCSVALVYHQTQKTLRCHYCQAAEPIPDICPVCQSRYIRYFGTGTQKVEEELNKLFPEARIIRMDQDTTGGKLDSDHIMHEFAAGKYDILLGTQMVAKGHDIKNVTAVGILAADSALNLPDFRSAERTFALLTQAAGRAGRGNLPGHVVVQTYNPDHYAVTAAAAQDYVAFYEQEIKYRAQLEYPPFAEMMKLTVLAANEQAAVTESNSLASVLKGLADQCGDVRILGPAPAAIARVKDVFRMNILVKAKNLQLFKEKISQSGLISRSDLLIDVDPVSLL